MTLRTATRKVKEDPERYEIEDWEWKVADKRFQMKLLRDKQTGQGQWIDELRRTK